jgi:hypothetical protein
MAIARGAGTEIIRSVHLETIADTDKPLIIGVQHHIYTVLSVIVFAENVNASGNYVRMYLLGYDSNAGTTQERHYIFRQGMNNHDTYVFNDKFSFNGYEPTDFTGPMDDATKQDAIADQGSSVSQKLYIDGEHSADSFDIIVLGNFDGTTFTAPVSGLYQFNATLVLGFVVIASGEYFRYRIITSNKTYDPLFDPRAFDAVPGHWALSHSVLADMDEGDTATFSIYTNNSSATADILGTETGWSGFLVQETL